MKHCTRCGEDYDDAAWAKLPFVGVQFDDMQAPLEALEARNCTKLERVEPDRWAPCNATLYRPLVLHPDDVLGSSLSDGDPDRGEVLRVLSDLQRALSAAKLKLREIEKLSAHLADVVAEVVAMGKD